MKNLLRGLGVLGQALAIMGLARLLARALDQPAAAPVGGPRPRPATGPGGGVKFLGRMVQDPVCGVYLPEEKALHVARGGRTVHYCGPTCRDRHAS